MVELLPQRSAFSYDSRIYFDHNPCQAQVQLAIHRPNERNGERIIGSTQTARILAQTIVVPEMTQVSKRDVGEHGFVRGMQLADYRAEGGQILRAGGRLDAQNRVLRMGIAGQG